MTNDQLAAIRELASKALDFFMECDTCRAKPGTPVLCNGCLRNRKTLMDVGKCAAGMVAEIERLRGAMLQLADCDLHDGNCASLAVASKRIRNIAREALKEKPCKA